MLIPLPNGACAEAVAHIGGDEFVASDIYSGDVYRLNVKSLAFGDILYVAGGGLALGAPPSLAAYNLQTGTLLTRCLLPRGIRRGQRRGGGCITCLLHRFVTAVVVRVGARAISVHATCD